MKNMILSRVAAAFSITVAMTFTLRADTFSSHDTTMSSVNWTPYANPTPPSSSALYNWGSSTNVTVAWDSSSGFNATNTYFQSRTDTAGPNGATIFYFGSNMSFDPASTLTGIESINLSVDLAKGAPNTATIQFTILQGTSLFYANPGQNIGSGYGQLLLTGLTTVTVSTNLNGGATSAIGTVSWLSQNGGTLDLSSSGAPIEFGLRMSGALGATATSGSRGPIVDNYFLDITYTSVPEPSTWALAGMGLLGLAIFRRRAIRH